MFLVADEWHWRYGFEIPAKWHFLHFESIIGYVKIRINRMILISFQQIIDLCHIGLKYSDQVPSDDDCIIDPLNDTKIQNLIF